MDLTSFLLLVVPWIHVVLAPYTKVEESFNLHATHDVFFYGIGRNALKYYDHFIFPGAVPRSFIGSLILGWTTRIVASVSVKWLSSKLDVQILARLILASANSFGLIFLQRAVSKRFGRGTGALFGIISCSQFHLPFWMGRTLPNMFALLPYNIATAYSLDVVPKIEWSIALLTFVAVVFRAELALYVGVFSLHLLFRQQVSLVRLVIVGVISGLTSLALTIFVDSYFWQQFPLWPEFSGIYFNVVQGKSSDWGTSPFHAYFTSHLPKLLMGALPLVIVGSTLDKRIRSLLIAPAIYVIAISALAHKEWRFVIYVVPQVNIGAAHGSYLLWIHARDKVKWSYWHRIFLRSFVLGLIGCNIIFTALLTKVSCSNYPGGEALLQSNRIISSGSRSVHLHISNLAAQTGASLFLQENSAPYLRNDYQLQWIYNKTENIVDYRGFTHAIVENEDLTQSWKVLDTIYGFNGLSLRGIRLAPKLWIISQEADV